MRINTCYISFIPFAMAVISYIWFCVGLCVLLMSVSCNTWLHPSEGGECICDLLQIVVICKNECKSKVGVLVWPPHMA